MSTALAYHRATKYAPDTIGQHPGMDWSRQPLPYKDYHCQEPVDLADHLPIDPNPFTGKPVDPQPVDDSALGLPLISRWIYFTYGVTGVVPNQPTPLYLRAAPSAGGLYPAECYLVVRSPLPGLEAGLYGYHPLKHQLIPLWSGEEVAIGLDLACYGNAAVHAAPIALVVSGVFERSAWRYRERAYRRILLDSGHLIGNATLVAHALGMRSHLTAAFCDQRLDALLRLDSEAEGTLAVIAADLPGANERPAWSALPSERGPAEPAGPLIGALHQASRLGEARPRPIPRGEEQAEELENRYGQRGGEVLIADPDEDCALCDGVLETILHRRSTRAFRRTPMARAQLARILACAYAPERVGLGEQPGLDRSQLLTFVAVVDVAGLDSGVYYFAPHTPELRLLRAGCKREDVQYLCLGQELGADACATVFHTADLPRAVERQGDRAYRYLHLDAGILGQRLNLAAIAEGCGASGIGGFFDDKVNEMLGIPKEQAVVYVTTLGIPREADDD